MVKARKNVVLSVGMGCFLRCGWLGGCGVQGSGVWGLQDVGFFEGVDAFLDLQDSQSL